MLIGWLIGLTPDWMIALLDDVREGLNGGLMPLPPVACFSVKQSAYRVLLSILLYARLTCPGASLAANYCAQLRRVD